VQPGYGIGFEKDVYLWIPVMGNIVAVLVIPFVGNLSDKIGRRPPIIVGALGLGAAVVRLPATRSASTTCRWPSRCRS
jgi:MFS family permease